METEYRKLKELKRKSEQYAIEAKQTAQRLSAENFKLKEDLSRERHHNELTRKNMLREMEQKLDKQATAEDRYELDQIYSKLKLLLWFLNANPRIEISVLVTSMSGTYHTICYLIE